MPTLRGISIITAAGLIRSHGPIRRRCPGSGKLSRNAVLNSPAGNQKTIPFSCKVPTCSNLFPCPHCFGHPFTWPHFFGHSIKSQTQDESDPAPSTAKPNGRKLANCPECEEDMLKSLSRRVSSMLEEGDFKGAIRLASSDDRWPPSTPPL